jgi:hypothetical protein
MTILATLLAMLSDSLNVLGTLFRRKKEVPALPQAPPTPMRKKETYSLTWTREVVVSEKK